MVDKHRIHFERDGSHRQGTVFYWMSRDQRVFDNWALLYAQEVALVRKSPFAVIFCLISTFLDAALRQYEFMLKGLSEVEATLRKFSIPFYVLAGRPERELVAFFQREQPSMIVTDFSPLRIPRGWKRSILNSLDVPFIEIDAHNIVPCKEASPKQEFGAYTIRPKIRSKLSQYLVEFPGVRRHPFNNVPTGSIDWEKIRQTIKVNKKIHEVDWIKPGETAAREMLRTFVRDRLPRYAYDRNDPNKNALSHLSPYLHFGQISAQRVALEVLSSGADKKSCDAFIEELIIRRELSENFCYYNPHYDSFEGFPPWAQQTLNEHRKDRREYLYSLDDFEQARTHDPLWNAAQLEMVTTGKMHGYMRMYWAKKILEWTESPEEALAIGIYLNDAYELDGRDPNGYTGLAWSIGGVHDRAWRERPVFGKIRYMNYNGCKRKFDVDAYISRFRP